MQPETTGRKHPIAKLKSWIHRHPTAAYALVGLGLIIAASITAFIVLWQEPQKLAVNAPAPKPQPASIYYSPLTGKKVATKAATTKPVTAIMLENSPDARPQSGLKSAEVVYEAVAEGGITRFLALYQQSKPSLVGPVRSLRLYYVDWLAPYNASVAHVGGSYKALQLVRGGGYRDIDQFFNPNAYWRATDRYAPHNVYTSFAKLKQLNAAKKYRSSKPVGLERESVTKASSQNAKKINLHISGPLYDSFYRYKPASKTYARFQAGAPHMDREKGQISAKVVIALKVSMKKVFEDGYRESIVTKGSGIGYVFQNGHKTTVKWQKDGRKKQLKFIVNGQPFKLARGTTWITAIPKDGGSITWQ